MDDDKNIKEGGNNRIGSKIFAIDIRKFILITPEMDKEAIFEMAKKFGFVINNPLKKDTGFFTLDAMGIQIEQFDDVIDKINLVKDEIKRQQINYYDKNKDKISVDSKMLELVSSFLTKAKKDSNMDSSELQMILNTVLGNLYEVDEENIRFLDEETIEHLAKATVSSVLDETKTHLNKALVNALIQIRKLAILWFFESISLDFYNLRTDRTETYKLQNYKKVEIKNTTYDVIPITIGRKKYRLAFSEVEHSLTTFDIGIKNQNLIIPTLAAIFIDKASLRWRLNYSKIIIKAISRLKDQTKHQIKNLKLDYNIIKVEDLLSAEKNMKESFEFLYQLLFNYKNQIETENHSLRNHYEKNYTKGLQDIVGGAISNAVRKVTPLDLLDECDGLVNELKVTLQEISNLKFEVISVVQELIKSKKEENPNLFKRGMDKLQEVGENVTAKTFSELMDKLLKK